MSDTGSSSRAICKGAEATIALLSFCLFRQCLGILFAAMNALAGFVAPYFYNNVSVPHRLLVSQTDLLPVPSRAPTVTVQEDLKPFCGGVQRTANRAPSRVPPRSALRSRASTPTRSTPNRENSSRTALQSRARSPPREEMSRAYRDAPLCRSKSVKFASSHDSSTDIVNAEDGNSAQSEESDGESVEDSASSSDVGKISKPPGEVGRPGRGGYNLKSKLGWDKHDFRKVQVRILLLRVR